MVGPRQPKKKLDRLRGTHQICEEKGASLYIDEVDQRCGTDAGLTLGVKVNWGGVRIRTSNLGPFKLLGNHVREN
jgi:hypothetical protein